MLKKLSILIGSSISLFILWMIGLEKLYAQVLKFGTSILLAPFSDVSTHLRIVNNHPDFCVAVGKEGYCMQMELFGLSIVVLLSWYVLLIALKPEKKRILMVLKYLAIFYFLQILTMSTLALYEYGTFFQQANEALRQSFIIIALVFIIHDNYLYEVFSFKNKQTSSS